MPLCRRRDLGAVQTWADDDIGESAVDNHYVDVEQVDLPVQR